MEVSNTNYNSKSIKRKNEKSEKVIEKKVKVDLAIESKFEINSGDTESSSDDSDTQELNQQKSKKYLQIKDKPINYSMSKIFSSFFCQHLERQKRNLNSQTQNEILERQYPIAARKNSKSDLENAKSNFEAGIESGNDLINVFNDLSGENELFKNSTESQNGQIRIFVVSNSSKELNSEKCSFLCTTIKKSVDPSMPSLEPIKIYETSNSNFDKNLTNLNPPILSQINSTSHQPKSPQNNSKSFQTSDIIDLTNDSSDDDDLIDTTPPVPFVDLTLGQESSAAVISDDKTCTEKCPLLHSQLKILC